MTDIGIHKTSREINHQQVKPGATWTLETIPLSMTVVVVCDDLDPELWRGGVRFGASTLLETEPCTNFEQAGNAARKAFEARVVQVFTPS
ncbi:hypothetical protein [Aeromicrobium sp. IC_218]|uniref:hypothetical protein n=1 Tax=Aeromicrobium sp. IC_218 TaxID=2545468 RepID=UPI00103CD9D9|nr:hypothetical protein [Aeromicrobium sp. IC_218]TCI96410.1 hypothetical protein E0W78_14855 [Aeromicrobium sp. IC_218]